MGVASRSMLQKAGLGVLALGLLAVGAIAGPGRAVYAENLDQGKSGARLFSESCVTCHRSARGLAKGRFSLTLYMFLQQHYVSTSGAAKELTSYLQSVDTAPPDRRPAAAKRSPHATGASSASPPPPAPVQTR